MPKQPWAEKALLSAIADLLEAASEHGLAANAAQRAHVLAALCDDAGRLATALAVIGWRRAL